MTQAASSVIYATPYVHSKGLDLDIIRDHLVSCLGPDFAHSAIENRYHHVSSRILRSTFTPIPSTFKLDSYLQEVVNDYDIDWSPEPRRLEMYLLSFLPIGLRSLRPAVLILSQNYWIQMQLQLLIYLSCKSCAHGVRVLNYL